MTTSFPLFFHVAATRATWQQLIQRDDGNLVVLVTQWTTAAEIMDQQLVVAAAAAAATGEGSHKHLFYANYYPELVETIGPRPVNDQGIPQC